MKTSLSLLFVLNANVLRLDDRRQHRSGTSIWTLKVSRLTDVERSTVGNEFHIVGAATRKLLVPSFVRVLGTNKSPRWAERRLDRAVLSVRHGNTDAHKIRRPHAPNSQKPMCPHYTEHISSSTLCLWAQRRRQAINTHSVTQWQCRARQCVTVTLSRGRGDS